MKYFKATLIHKWYVFLAGIRLGGIPLWRLIVHDWQKFTPQELPHYNRYFFGGKQDKDKEAFLYAWVHHVHYGPHHWEYWLLNPGYNFATAENGRIPMPETYIREMIADWMGASMSYTGSWDMTEWLKDNAPRIRLHTKTKRDIGLVLESIGYDMRGIEFCC